MEKKVEYFDTSGRPLKTQVIPQVKEVDSEAHAWWALRREIVNHQTGHNTVLSFDSLDAAQPVKDDFFTPRYLEREK